MCGGIDSESCAVCDGRPGTGSDAKLTNTFDDAKAWPPETERGQPSSSDLGDAKPVRRRELELQERLREGQRELLREVQQQQQQEVERLRFREAERKRNEELAQQHRAQAMEPGPWQRWQAPPQHRRWTAEAASVHSQPTSSLSVPQAAGAGPRSRGKASRLSLDEQIRRLDELELQQRAEEQRQREVLRDTGAALKASLKTPELGTSDAGPKEHGLQAGTGIRDCSQLFDAQEGTGAESAPKQVAIEMDMHAGAPAVGDGSDELPSLEQLLARIDEDEEVDASRGAFFRLGGPPAPAESSEAEEEVEDNVERPVLFERRPAAWREPRGWGHARQARHSTEAPARLLNESALFAEPSDAQQVPRGRPP